MRSIVETWEECVRLAGVTSRGVLRGGLYQGPGRRAGRRTRYAVKRRVST